MKVKTKSGFSCELDENKVKDYRYLKLAVAVHKAKSDIEALEAQMDLADFLIPEPIMNELIKHVEKDGVSNILDVQNEIREITKIIGEEAKKSKSSQE